MAILKRFFSIFIVLNIILTSNISLFAYYNCDTLPTTAQVNTVYGSNSESTNKNHLDIMKNILGESLNDFKEYLTNEIYFQPKSIKVSQYNIPNNEDIIKALCDYVYYEIPEAFNFIKFSYARNSSYLLYLYPKYTMTVDEYQTKLSICNANAEKLLLGITDNSKLKSYEKALLIHDRLALNCEFDYELIESSEINNEDFAYTMYGAMCDGEAVCLGYAEAYSFLLEKAGIQSRICVSTSMNHAWNIIYIDNEAYHVDVTWDDGYVNGGVEHNYFLLSTEAFYRGVNGTQGHNATDYLNEPTDTYFDSFYWQSSYTAFQLINDELYYFNNKSCQLIRNSDGKVLYTVSDRWQNNSSSYYSGNYSKLSSDGNVLFVSDSKNVSLLNINNMTSMVIFTPDLSVGNYYSIFGMIYSDGNIICDLFNSPARDKANMIKYQQLEYTPEIIKGDVDNDGMLTVKDISMLRRALVGNWNITVDINISDYDENGRFELKDIIQFRRKMVGM